MKLILTENQLDLIQTAIEWAHGSCAGVTKEQDEDLYEYHKKFLILDEQVMRQVRKAYAKKN